MKFIANILTPKSFSDNELYNVVSNKEQLIDGIPTLVIGWEFAHKMYPEVNILNWQIDKNTYWTFGNREKRERFEPNVAKFRELALNRFVKSIKYKFFNILTSTEEEKSLFTDYIKNTSLTAYINGDMIYLYNAFDNSAIGVSLTNFEYGEYNTKKLFSFIYKSPNITIIDVKNEISWETKNALRNYNYAIPCLYS